MLQVHGEMNYNGAEAVGNFRIVGNPSPTGLWKRCPSYGRSSVSFWLTKWHEARGPWRVRRVRSHATLLACGCGSSSNGVCGGADHVENAFRL